jgi:hypothetical protein
MAVRASCDARCMPSYLVEAYAADSPTTLTEARECARRTAELGTGVTYLRTTFVPGDETILHFFEAPSPEALGEAGRLASLAFERIVEAVEETTERSRA